MTIIEALQDRDLFGGLRPFRDLSSWSRWLVFLQALYGLPLDAAELRTFQEFTGRTLPRPGGYPEAAAIVGRQSGKSLIAATITTFAATTGGDRGTFGLLIGQDQRAALRAVFTYTREPFRAVPALRGEVVRETADTLELQSGVSVACYPCRPEAVRGVRAVVAVLDELAFYRSSENLPADREMLRAVRPCLATTGGKLIILSSPYGQSGLLWDLYRTHYGRDDSPVLVWQAAAPAMNPTLPADYLQRMQADDPEAYRSEVLGEFRAGVATLLDPGALEGCVIPGRRELLPQPDLDYGAFTDPSGGRGDAWTVAIGHRAGEQCVLDCLRAWPPPFNPAGVAAEVAAVLKTYDIRSVVGDRFGGEWPREALQGHGIDYEIAEHPKSDLYLNLLPLVNAGQVALLDRPDLLRELRALERHRGPSGRDRVDHRPGEHDDLANSVAGLLDLLATGPFPHPHYLPQAYGSRQAVAQAWTERVARECGYPSPWGGR